MSRRILWVLAAFLVVLLCAWLFWPRPVVVQMLTVKRGVATRVLAVNGRIRPRLSIDVQSPVAGKLIRLPYDVGDQINQGTLLASVDDAPERAAIEQAEAALAAQRGELVQAQRDVKRYEALLAQGFSLQRVEQARLAVRQGQDEVRRLTASVKQAREVQKRHEIRAPFAGVITERPVDPGQTVGSETVLYRLANLTAPEVTAQVDELYAAELSIGQSALVAVPGFARSLTAEVVHIERRVDPETGARAVRLRFNQPPEKTSAGLTVSVNLIVDRQQNAISIPRSAILSPSGNPHVRIIDNSNVVADQPITFIDWPAEQVIVATGLKPGMRLLADPQSAKPGERVRTAG